ncbi:MAG: hypothetical protein WAM85_09065 [Terracidiphilus sp.]
MIHDATLTLGGTTLADQTIALLPIACIEDEAGVPTDAEQPNYFCARAQFLRLRGRTESIIVEVSE